MTSLWAGGAVLCVMLLPKPLGGGVPARAQPAASGPTDSRVDLDALASEPAMKAALAQARRDEPRTLADQVRFCETPAPPFGERARADLLRAEFTRIGLRDVRVDRAGNVLGEWPGVAARPHLLLASHLDTVFPSGTPVKVQRDGAILRGPGIGDNCRGLAVLVAVARIVRESKIMMAGSITFAADVGEEGLGDLRGVKALFGFPAKVGDVVRAPSVLDVDRFVSIDGTGISVTNIAVGSQRVRATFAGPGGHSFGAFGTASPIGALGRAIARIAEFRVPREPRTTFNVGRVGGGTSVNAIPQDAWMEVDLRSSDSRELSKLIAQLQDVVEAAVREENARWGMPGAVTVSQELVGRRPGGATPVESPVVQAAVDAARVLGLRAALNEGSTDANLPMSLGIPAVTIGGGGRGFHAHALDESFDATNAWQGTAHALLVTIALVSR